MKIDLSYREFSYHTIKKEIEEQLKKSHESNEETPSASTTQAENSLVTLEGDVASKALTQFEKVRDEMKSEFLNILNTKERGENLSGGSININAIKIDLKIMAEDAVVEKEVKLNFTDIEAKRLNITKEMSAKHKLLDPLVINFDGKSTELSSEKFEFDLDSDGRKDQISMLKGNSGYLALDRNNNGKIDDGSELFGAKSGDGFADLAILDSNFDGVINSDDTIYDRLRIWRKNENGEDRLVALGEAGVGVIHLNAQKNEEMVYDKKGQLAGVIQKSAFVEMQNRRENAIIQHIDLVAG